MSKPTMSRDGVKRVELRVRHRLSITDLAHALWRASSSGFGIESDGYPRNPSAKVRAAVTGYLEAYGTPDFFDDVEYTGSARAQRWALEHIARAFGFDESEIPEPEIDERAARRVAFYENGGHPDDYDEN